MHEHVHALASVGSHLDLVAFLTLGFLGSAGHCVGMCAPFVLIVSRRYARPVGALVPWAAQAWYTAGRLVTYGTLGAAAGALGSALQVAGALMGLQRAAAVLAGGALIVSGAAGLLSFSPGASPGLWAHRLTGRLSARMPSHPFTLGLLLGLLPCGLLYTAVLGAMATGGPARGALALVAFGLGTAPALLGVSLADALLIRQRTTLNRLSQVFVLVMGAWFLWHAALPVMHH
ncbi:MAG: sulfite exporter TauE/SafE family protein [Acidobacteria bacterium]|nr:sulfite exporter TauE/SafE family protein [Acidobacteriota bacterium]